MLNSCLRYSLLKLNWAEKNILTQNCGIKYVGRDLRGCLIQPPVESSINTEFKSCCSGLCPLKSWNPPEMEVVQPLQAPVPTFGCYQGEKYFETEPPLFQFMIVVAHHSVHHCKDPGYVSSLFRYQKAAKMLKALSRLSKLSSLSLSS